MNDLFVEIVEKVPLGERWKVYSSRAAFEDAIKLFYSRYGRNPEKALQDNHGQWWLGPLHDADQEHPCGWMEQDTNQYDAIGAPQVTHTTRNGVGRVGRIKKGE